MQPRPSRDRFLGGSERIPPAPRDDGYRGIWFTLSQMSEYGDKNPGGFATYTAKHLPLAVYSPEVEKTFFVYGGMPKDGHLSDEKRTLLIMVSCYDHATDTVPRPTRLLHWHEIDRYAGLYPQH